MGLEKHRIDDVLNIVGLHDSANKKAGKYSTGMKQRLGIAKALLTDPELIILDEPTTGLDPAGKIEIRKLLLDLKNEHGKTVFLSSHLLDEVEKTCSEVAIIDNGQMLFQGSLDDLNQLNNEFLYLNIEPIGDSKQYFDEQQIAYEISDQKIIRIPFISDHETAELIKNLVAKNILIYSVEKKKNSLEELFMQIINR